MGTKHLLNDKITNIQITELKELKRELLDGFPTFLI